MSQTKEWKARLANHHYSQDDRTKAYNYKKELDAKLSKFIDDFSQNTYLVGTFNLEKEPWRLSAINEFRNMGMKIHTKENLNDKTLTDVSLIKKKLTKIRLG